MKIKRINLFELQGKIINRPDMKFLVGACGGDGGVDIECNASCGVCLIPEYDIYGGWIGCKATGDRKDFCCYGYEPFFGRRKTSANFWCAVHD